MQNTKLYQQKYDLSFTKPLKASTLPTEKKHLVDWSQ